MEPRATSRVPAGDRATRKRTAIIRAARAAFLREGFDVSVDAIAAGAGVSKVTVYNHFGSKEALFLGVIRDRSKPPSKAPRSRRHRHLAEADDLRDALPNRASWVQAPDSTRVLALRHVVSHELRRFPELGPAWHPGGPGPCITRRGNTFHILRIRAACGMPASTSPSSSSTPLVLYPHLIPQCLRHSPDRGDDRRPHHVRRGHVPGLLQLSADRGSEPVDPATPR